jgi:hypothetical protein
MMFNKIDLWLQNNRSKVYKTTVGLNLLSGLSCLLIGHPFIALANFLVAGLLILDWKQQ